MSVKIELNSSGIQKLLKSSEVQSCVSDVASSVAARCGTGYDTDTYTTPGRVVASVFTTDSKSVKDNLDNNTLLRAVSS